MTKGTKKGLYIVGYIIIGAIIYYALYKWYTNSNSSSKSGY